MNSDCKTKKIEDKFNCNGCFYGYNLSDLFLTHDHMLFCCSCNFKRVNERFIDTFCK